MSNVNTDSVFSEHVLKAIQSTRNSKLLPEYHIIFDYVTKNFGTNADASLIYATIQALLNKSLTENGPTNKDDSFFIKHTSSDFHEVGERQMKEEETNNFHNLAQATQIFALISYSYVNNDVLNAFHVDYIES